MARVSGVLRFLIIYSRPGGTLRARLIGRKLAGGLSQAEAETFYERTDGPNVRRVLESSLPADLMLEMTSTGEYRMACP